MRRGPELFTDKILRISLSCRFFELLSYFGFDAGSFSHLSVSATCSRPGPWHASHPMPISVHVELYFFAAMS